MPSASEIPSPLRGRPFRLEEAIAFGLTKRVLQGRRFPRLHRHPHQIRIAGVHTHRVPKQAVATMHDGLPLLSPEQSFVTSATQLGQVDLIAAGDWLLSLGRTTRARLAATIASSHCDGVVAARAAAPFVREGVEAPRETHVRLILVLAGLPEPRCNESIAHGREFVARIDLSYPEWKVAIEYDGRQHAEDPRQWRHDLRRRERLEALGWRVIVVTGGDLDRPREVVRRVRSALQARGYRGPVPACGRQWQAAFAR